MPSGLPGWDRPHSALVEEGPELNRFDQEGPVRSWCRFIYARAFASGTAGRGLLSAASGSQKSTGASGADTRTMTTKPRYPPSSCSRTPKA